MKSPFKISIPQPCPENWEGMTPDTNGRFCNQCGKNVIDFTEKTPAEIQQYFRQQQGKKICGRFNDSQLEKNIIRIPQQVLLNQVQFHKIFLLALLFTMGTTLLSCQEEDGSRKKIDGVTIETTQTHNTMGMPLPNYTNETAHGVASDTVDIQKMPQTKKEAPQTTILRTKGEVVLEPMQEHTPEIITPSQDSLEKVD